MPDGSVPSLRKDGYTKTPVTYLDYTVDGIRLMQHLGVTDVLDYVGVIQDAWPIESVSAIERLLGEAPGDLPDGRVSLYVCPECGDLGCGAVTATITREPETVIWRAIAFQTDNEDKLFPLDGVEGAHVTFDHGTYERVLRLELDRLRPLLEGFEYPSQRDQRERREQRGRRLRWLRRDR